MRTDIEATPTLDATAAADGSLITRDGTPVRSVHGKFLIVQLSGPIVTGAPIVR